MPLALFTDCRSLYDHVKVEGNVPDDRHDAVWLGALKSHVSCGPQRDESKAGLRWLPSRWMISDGLTKKGVERQGAGVHETKQDTSTRGECPGHQAKSGEEGRGREACGPPSNLLLISLHSSRFRSSSAGAKQERSRGPCRTAAAPAAPARGATAGGGYRSTLVGRKSARKRRTTVQGGRSRSARRRGAARSRSARSRGAWSA